MVAFEVAPVRRRRNEPMQVVVTAQSAEMSSEVDPRFGRARHFLVVDLETGECTPHDNTQNLQAAQGAGIQAAQQVVALGVEAVLTGNVGPKAFRVLEADGVKVCVGVRGSVADAVDKYRAGQYQPVAQANVEGHWA